MQLLYSNLFPYVVFFLKKNGTAFNTSKEIEYRYSIKANRVCSWKEPSKSLLSLTASFIRGGCSYLFMPSKEGQNNTTGEAQEHNPYKRLD